MRSPQHELLTGERAPAAPERGPLAVFETVEDLLGKEMRRPTEGAALAQHPAVRADADQDQVLAVLGAPHGIEQRLQIGAVPAQRAGAIFGGEVEPRRVDEGLDHGASDCGAGFKTRPPPSPPPPPIGARLWRRSPWPRRCGSR